MVATSTAVEIAVVVGAVIIPISLDDEESVVDASGLESFVSGGGVSVTSSAAGPGRGRRTPPGRGP